MVTATVLAASHVARPSAKSSRWPAATAPISSHAANPTLMAIFIAPPKDAGASVPHEPSPRTSSLIVRTRRRRCHPGRYGHPDHTGVPSGQRGWWFRGTVEGSVGRSGALAAAPRVDTEVVERTGQHGQSGGRGEVAPDGPVA